MTTIISNCTCKNEFQDELYGVGMRVMNITAGRSGGSARCTVCRASHDVKTDAPAVAVKQKKTVESKEAKPIEMKGAKKDVSKNKK